MSDALPPAPLSPPSSVFSDERQMAMIIYILLLVGLTTFHVASIVGVILAYVNRDSAPEWLRNHYTFQIRTFWIGLLYFVVSCACFFIVIGIPMILAAMAWYIIRCALGINHLLKHEAYPTPESWFL